MTTQRFVLTSLLILALLVPGASASLAQPAASPAAPAPASAPAAPGDEYWAAGFNLPGMNGTVRPGGWAGWLALRWGTASTTAGASQPTASPAGTR